MGKNNLPQIGEFWWSRENVLIHIIDILPDSNFPLIGKICGGEAVNTWERDGKFISGTSPTASKDLWVLDLVKKETDSKVILKEYIKRKTKGN